MRHRRYRKKYTLEGFIRVISILLITFIFVSFTSPRQYSIYSSVFDGFSELTTLGIMILIPCLIGLITIYLLGQYKQAETYKKAGIFDIDRMSGSEFEEKLVIMFAGLGYATQRTGKVGDYGVDLILEKDGIRIAVQAKRYDHNNHVSESAVQQVYTGCKYYNCNEALIVTNSTYTLQAETLARSTNVTLWDRNDLINALIESKD